MSAAVDRLDNWTVEPIYESVYESVYEPVGRHAVCLLADNHAVDRPPTVESKPKPVGSVQRDRTGNDCQPKSLGVCRVDCY